MVKLARRHLPAAVADAWVSLLRPGLHLRSAEDDESLVGQLGGVPELPEDVAWPHLVGHGPLKFIADIDCGELPSYRLGMPATGTLLFFYLDGLFDEARVVYVPRGTPVAERDPPTGIEPYKMVPLTGELRTTGPNWNHPAVHDAVRRLGAQDRAFMADWDNIDPFSAALWEVTPIPRHQVGGYAHPVQDAVEYSVAHAVLGDSVSYDDPALHREAIRWRLLAQIDSDDQAGMMWGDVGTLYWLIRPDDLAARRFEAASFTWQCS